MGWEKVLPAHVFIVFDKADKTSHVGIAMPKDGTADARDHALDQLHTQITDIERVDYTFHAFEARLKTEESVLQGMRSGTLMIHEENTPVVQLETLNLVMWRGANVHAHPVVSVSFVIDPVEPETWEPYVFPDDLTKRFATCNMQE